MPPPVGPEVDATPRPLPARVPLRGQYVVLEPLHRRHAAELWTPRKAPTTVGGIRVRAVRLGRGDGPLRCRLRGRARPGRVGGAAVATGLASGWLTLLDIQPKNASIQLGSIWFSPRMQRSCAATEAMFLPLRLAADELGYRRLVWKCNALNAPSKRAAERLGFSYAGRHRMHMVSKGRQRDTDLYSIIADEWPRCRDALVAWLDPGNFGADGRPCVGWPSCGNPGGRTIWKELE